MHIPVSQPVAFDRTLPFPTLGVDQISLDMGGGKAVSRRRCESLVILRIGGGSVATPDRIMAAARRTLRARQAGHQVIVVVSARGRITDGLAALAHAITDRPPTREMDMLLSTGEQKAMALVAMAMQVLGQPAVSLTGAQAGIVTDSSHTSAKIRFVDTRRIHKALDEGKCVIVAGGQGVDEDGTITTFGSQGADVTALALSAALRGDPSRRFHMVRCEWSDNPDED
jgi:aspartate kinase